MSRLDFWTAEDRYEGREQALINKAKREAQDKGKTFRCFPHPTMRNTWLIKEVKPC